MKVRADMVGWYIDVNLLSQLYVCDKVPMNLLVFRRKDLCEAKHDVWCLKFWPKITIFGGGGKSYRHQIRLGNLRQIAKSDLVSVRFTPPNRQVWFGVCMIWCLYNLSPTICQVQFGAKSNLVSVWFTSPPNHQVRFGVCTIWYLYDLPPSPKSPSLIYPEIA